MLTSTIRRRDLFVQIPLDISKFMSLHASANIVFNVVYSCRGYFMDDFALRQRIKLDLC
jgi:hypothetical protein